MGAALLAKLPKMVWGKSRNVTDNSPTRLGALRAALSYPKHSGGQHVPHNSSTVLASYPVSCGGLAL